MHITRNSQLRTGIFIILLTTLSACEPPPHSWPPELAQYIKQSAFIFEGTVIETTASNVAVVHPTPHTAVVRVGKVLHGSGPYAHYAGNEATVLVRDLSGIKPQSRYVFFTSGWIIGRKLAVREVGRLGGYELADLQDTIRSIQRQQAFKVIEDHVRQADVVFTGSVLKVGDPDPAVDYPGRPRLSEHDPQWQEAIIKVNNMLKGESDSQTLKVLFPGSRDVAWYLVPKFKVGQEGIWILKKYSELKAYAVTQRKDFMPLAQLDEIIKITRGSQ